MQSLGQGLREALPWVGSTNKSLSTPEGVEFRAETALVARFSSVLLARYLCFLLFPRSFPFVPFVFLVCHYAGRSRRLLLQISVEPIGKAPNVPAHGQPSVFAAVMHNQFDVAAGQVSLRFES